jgi:two-component system response regulator PhoP
MRLLVIEDEPLLQRQLQADLQSQGFTVDVCGEGREGLYRASEYPFDAAVIDLGLPGLPGLEVIRRLRQLGSRLPVLVLTARGRWQDKVEGLEAGADDYLTKPFQPEELQARLNALLRRAAGSARNDIVCGPLVIEPAAQRVTLDGRALDLTTYEYRLLEHLVRQRHRVVPKDELAAHLYPQDEERDSNVIEVLVGRVRRKIDPESRRHPLQTLRGRGYRFVMDDASSP